jgi:hypothetical protein
MRNTKLDGNQVSADSNRLMTVTEVADYLRMSPDWVRQHSNCRCQPTIPSLKLGKYRRFKWEAVQEFVRQMERGTGVVTGRDDRPWPSPCTPVLSDPFGGAF